MDGAARLTKPIKAPAALQQRANALDFVTYLLLRALKDAERQLAVQRLVDGLSALDQRTSNSLRLVDELAQPPVVALKQAARHLVLHELQGEDLGPDGPEVLHARAPPVVALHRRVHAEPPQPAIAVRLRDYALFEPDGAVVPLHQAEAPGQDAAPLADALAAQHDFLQRVLVHLPRPGLELLQVLVHFGVVVRALDFLLPQQLGQLEVAPRLREVAEPPAALVVVRLLPAEARYGKERHAYAALYRRRQIPVALLHEADGAPPRGDGVVVDHPADAPAPLQVVHAVFREVKHDHGVCVEIEPPTRQVRAHQDAGGAAKETFVVPPALHDRYLPMQARRRQPCVPEDVLHRAAALDAVAEHQDLLATPRPLVPQEVHQLQRLVPALQVAELV
ncbi:oxidoreductase YetM [Babesia caballi]|uniref:Oxidoreductase YetM n=1 Tax=Babesia caballi TaxID=5871 RepID=A0AAV4LQD7_BABCB|nr:oxidoreductase YetM [Babesia caballi]